MPSRLATRAGRFTAAAIALCLPATAHAARVEDPGGTAAPEPAAVAAVSCADPCAPGRQVVVSGSGLEGVAKVVFLGADGAADDRAAPAGKRSSDAEVRVTVPAGAVAGPLLVTAPGGAVRTAPLAVAGGARKLAAQTPVFPIAGRHRIGTSAVQRFGGARGHEGQDVFARCGTPVVANAAGTVKVAEWQSAAGNYVVVDGDDGRSYAFMHLREPASVQPGDALYAGEPIGLVGDTGRATGCHLHFEDWTAPGWYTGGHPVDPLPELRAWDRAAAAKARKAKRR